MISSRVRKTLSGIGQGIDPIFQIGKNGITEVLLNELSTALEARELIKIAVLPNSDLSAKEVINELCASLGADPVSCLGNKMVIYRRSERKDIRHIEF